MNFPMKEFFVRTEFLNVSVNSHPKICWESSMELEVILLSIIKNQSFSIDFERFLF